MNLQAGKIEFIEHHKPALRSGDYLVKTTQKVAVKKEEKYHLETNRNFSVGGPRFQLAPQDIFAVFPPPASTGEHTHVLPHVILNRSTLPWEREIWKDSAVGPAGAGASASWLALLVFHHDELNDGRLSEPRTLKLDELEKEVGFPKFKRETLQHPDDPVTVINVKRELLEKILPRPAELDFLSHVRQRKTLSVNVDIAYLDPLVKLPAKESRELKTVFGDKLDAFLNDLRKHGIRLSPNSTARCPKNEAASSGEKTKYVLTDGATEREYMAREDHDGTIPVLNVFTNDAEVAVVVANRLPQAQGNTIVHLVSLEDRFTADGHFAGLESGNAPVPLVTLKSWSFNCTSPLHTFGELSKKLDRSLFRLPAPPNTGNNGNNPGAPLLDQGYVPLHHYPRRGDKTLSWYHGPFLPQRNMDRLFGLRRIDSIDEELNKAMKEDCADHGWLQGNHGKRYWIDRDALHHERFAAYEAMPYFGCDLQAADQLLRLNFRNDVFDVSYAAAWKLGRLLALENQAFSVPLTIWKRDNALRVHRQRQFEAAPHLHVEDHPHLHASLPPPPPEVSGWLDRLNLLEGVPFNYLVPDARLLPPESIRFFEVDPLWMDCLLDGAFSLGRAIEADAKLDFLHIVADNRYPRMTGVLIRSEVVEGWPGLIADAWLKIVNQPGVETALDNVNSGTNFDILRKEWAAHGLPLPRVHILKSADGRTWNLADIDDCPHYIDTVLEGAGGSDPQVCLMVPDRDRQYHYTVEKDGATGELFLKLPVLRRVRLGENVLLLLFQGGFERVDLHLEPETLHFGLKQENSGGFSKDLKGENGRELEGVNLPVEGEAFWRDRNLGVLEITKLAWGMKDKLSKVEKPNQQSALTPDTISSSGNGREFTAAQFALQMIEGNELIRFLVCQGT